MSDKQRELELYAIRQIMKTENGRNFIHRCLQRCSTYDTVFDKDPYRHAFNSGLRDFGIWLEREVKEAADESFLTMLRENKDGR